MQTLPLRSQCFVPSGLMSALLGLLALVIMTQTTAQAFELNDVAKKAAALSTQTYLPKSSTLPDQLQALTYDQYRDIRFKPERALWRNENLPFEAMFFHLGKFQTEPVLMNEIDALGKVKPLSFNRDDFDYGKNTLSPQTWGDVGYAGFRLHYPLNNPAYKDEVVVFLGASYFRAVGSDQHYGLSARGLAIDTVGGQGEEFPRFSEFWIEKPKAAATSIVIYALMESKRLTGAYRFEIVPGVDTVTNVQSQIFLRTAKDAMDGAAPIATLAIAPLTSMFAFGENQPHRIDFRPEVHDSDGLMVATGDGEWLWRPLLNPTSVLTTSFAMRSLRGFGLMQRDQQFNSYEDTEARYEKRPSAWITPQGDWGAGRVELMQLSTPDETNDNVVAYWVPEKMPTAGQPLSLAYQLRWQLKQQQRPPGAWVTQTRVGRGFDALADNEQQFVVDFKGGLLDSAPASTPIKAVASADANGEIVAVNCYRNEANGTWRMTLKVKHINRTQPVELRAFLQSSNDTVSETWTNLIPAQ